jgi:hypothetical protein
LKSLKPDDNPTSVVNFGSDDGSDAPPRGTQPTPEAMSQAAPLDASDRKRSGMHDFRAQDAPADGLNPHQLARSLESRGESREGRKWGEEGR